MLFLFDIDGTLLRSMPPVHRAAISDAMRAVYGIDLPPEQLGQTAGMTDIAIAARVLRNAGISDEAITEGCRASSPSRRITTTPTSPTTSASTPRRTAARRWTGWSSLAPRSRLVTGNVERVAWSKLRAAKIDTYFSCGRLRR